MYIPILISIYISCNSAMLFLTSEHLNGDSNFQLCHFVNHKCIKSTNITFSNEVAFRSFYMDMNTHYYVLSVREQYNATINVYDKYNNMMYSTTKKDPINDIILTTHNDSLSLYGFTTNLERITDEKILYEFINCIPSSTFDFYDDTYYVSVRCLDRLNKRRIYVMNVNTNIVHQIITSYDHYSINYNPISKLLYIIKNDDDTSQLKLITLNIDTLEVNHLTSIKHHSVLTCGWNNTYTQLFCSMCDYLCPENGPIILLKYDISTNMTSYESVPYYIWKIMG